MEPDDKTCPMCAEAVKAAAAVCKHCGHRFQTANTNGVRRGKAGWGTFLLLVVGGVTLIALLVTAYNTKPLDTSVGTARSAGDTNDTYTASTEITAEELARAYTANEVAAQNAYGDRTLIVTGTVTGITLDFLNHPTIQMAGVNEFLPVQARFDSDEDGRIAHISKGQTVTIRCTSITEVISAPMLSDCSLP